MAEGEMRCGRRGGKACCKNGSGREGAGYGNLVDMYRRWD